MDRRVPEIGFSGIIRNQPKDEFQKLFWSKFCSSSCKLHFEKSSNIAKKLGIHQFTINPFLHGTSSINRLLIPEMKTADRRFIRKPILIGRIPH